MGNYFGCCWAGGVFSWVLALQGLHHVAEGVRPSLSGQAPDSTGGSLQEVAVLLQIPADQLSAIEFLRGHVLHLLDVSPNHGETLVTLLLIVAHFRTVK